MCDCVFVSNNMDTFITNKPKVKNWNEPKQGKQKGQARPK